MIKWDVQNQRDPGSDVYNIEAVVQNHEVVLSDINYHINRINAEPLHLLSDVNIASLHFFAAAVEADDLFLLVDFLEHLLHLL